MQLAATLVLVVLRNGSFPTSLLTLTQGLLLESITYFNVACPNALHALYESSPGTQSSALSTLLLSFATCLLVFFFCAVPGTFFVLSADCSTYVLPFYSRTARRVFTTNHGLYASFWQLFLLLSTFLTFFTRSPGLGTPSTRSGHLRLSILAIVLLCLGFSDAAAPVVYELQPTVGPSAGGSMLTVRGNNLVGRDVFCKFGSDALVAPITLSATQMVCDTPSQAASRVMVEVTTDGGLSYSGNNVAYLYSELEVVTSISPSKGPDLGSTVVRVSGSGFRNFASLSCMFGVTVISAKWLSEDAVECVTPPKNAGLEVSVRVANNGIDFSTSYGVFLMTGVSQKNLMR